MSQGKREGSSSNPCLQGLVRPAAASNAQHAPRQHYQRQAARHRDLTTGTLGADNQPGKEIQRQAFNILSKLIVAGVAGLPGQANGPEAVTRVDPAYAE